MNFSSENCSSSDHKIHQQVTELIMENNNQIIKRESPVSQTGSRILSPKEVVVNIGSDVFFSGGIQETTLHNIYEAMKCGEFEQPIDGLNSTYLEQLQEVASLKCEAVRTGDTTKYDQKKKVLPAFTWSGSFDKNQGPPKKDTLLRHTGRLQGDIDMPNENTDPSARNPRTVEEAKDLRDELSLDPHIEVALLSPGRFGIKLGIIIPVCEDDAEHKRCFAAAQRYMWEKYRLEIDESCKDVRRVCFLSYDPDLKLNLEAVPLNVEKWTQEEKGTKKTGIGKAKEASKRHSQNQSDTEGFLSVRPDVPEHVLKDDAAKYLSRSLEKIKEAPQGTRHNTYIRVAYALGGLVAGGSLDRESTLDQLISSARDSHAEDPDPAERSVVDCFANGEAEPCWLEPSWGYRVAERIFTNLKDVEKRSNGKSVDTKIEDEQFHLKGGKAALKQIPNLHFNNKENLVPNEHNVSELLRLFEYNLWYDDFHHEIKKEDSKGCHVNWEEEDTLNLRLQLQNCNPGLRRIPRNVVEDGMKHRANLFKRNELKDYLDSLKWDGTQRIDTWLIDYAGAEDNLFTREAGGKWLLAAVARAYKPGIKFDHCLVMSGKQGGGKSTLLAILGGDWFVEILEVVSQKDLGEKVRGRWIVEFPEMSAMTKADKNMMKSIITATTDRFRPAYGRKAKDFDRTCVLAGTTNADQFLGDSTGNRRFWPVGVADVLERDQLLADKDQIWAEAVHRYKKGDSFLLSEDAQVLAKVAQEERYAPDAWESIISKYLLDQDPNHFDGVTIGELAQEETCLKLTPRDMNRGVSTKIGMILSKLGWRGERNLRSGVKEGVYYPTDNAEVFPGGPRYLKLQARKAFAKKVLAFEGTHWLAPDQIIKAVHMVCGWHQCPKAGRAEDVDPNVRNAVLRHLEYIERVQQDFLTGPIQLKEVAIQEEVRNLLHGSEVPLNPTLHTPIAVHPDKYEQFITLLNERLFQDLEL